MKYSVIIPTFNRSSKLMGCLESVSRQTIPKEEYEIVIVDDGSTDDTRLVVEKFKATFKNVIYIRQKNAGCSAARNTGIRRANGSILFFTDDDCIVPENWISKISEVFSSYPDAVGVGGWYLFDNQVLKNNAYLRMYAQGHILAFPDFTECSFVSNDFATPFGNTSNTAYKKEIFEKIGFFDTYTKKTARMDWEFKLRIAYSGFQTVYIPLNVRHQKQMFLREFLYKGFYYGMADYYFSTRFKNYNKMVYFKKIFYPLESFVKMNENPEVFLYMLTLLLRWFGARYAKLKKIKSSVRYEYKDILQESHKIYPDHADEYSQQYPHAEYIYGESFNKARNDANTLLHSSHETPVCSIVIPLCNSAQYLTPDFVSNINALTCHETAVEIIFIDRGSVDGTLQVLQHIIPQLRFRAYVHTKVGAGRTSARNSGIKHSKGNFVFFTDPDVRLPKYWLGELLFPMFFNSKVASSGGSLYSSSPRTKIDMHRNSIINLRQKFTITTDLTSVPFDTANMCINKHILEKENSLFFDEHYPTSDREGFDHAISIRQKGMVSAYVPVTVSTIKSLSFKDFLMECKELMRAEERLRQKYFEEKRMYEYFKEMRTNKLTVAADVLSLFFRRRRRLRMLSMLKKYCLSRPGSKKLTAFLDLSLNRAK